MRKTELSNRLQTVVNMLDAKSKRVSVGKTIGTAFTGTMEDEGYCVADIGCDHGFVSIYLFEHKIASRVIAMDVNQGPLQFAREHVKEAGLEAYIDVRLSDGFSSLQKGEANAAVIAGMGGRLMVRLLEEGKEKIALMQELVLQPQSEVSLLRQYIRNAGYRLVEEEMVLEEGKFYTILHVYIQPDKSGTSKTLMSSQQTALPQTLQPLPQPALPLPQTVLDKYGEDLIAKKHPVLVEYVAYRLERHEKILASYPENGDEVKRKELITIVDELKAIIAYWEGIYNEM